MLMAAKALRDSCLPLRGTLTIQAVMDEEDAGNGTRFSVARGLKADFAIVGEPTSLQVAVAAKGSSTFVIRTSGKAAHSSVPHEGLNAVYKMKRVIGGLEELSNQLKSKTHPILGHPTVSVDVIEGGASPWIVPESCRIILDRRVLPGETQEEVQDELDQLLKRLKKDDTAMITQLSIYQTALPAEISPHERIAQIALEQTSAVTGVAAEPAGLSGTTDARFLINDARIPTIILGPGSLSQAHKANEHVPLTEVYQASDIYARIAMKALH
jgi:acetylornithine deacetylase/succinyl-diaminopimelate desuccinylase-like protein